MYHRIALLGAPGVGKSSAGLSYPGVLQAVWGSSEESTALNFPGRTDILPPVKLDWYETLKPEEQEKFTDEKVSELDIAQLTRLGRARNVARFRRLIYTWKAELLGGKRPELQSIFLDNLTPFSQELEDYVEVVYGKELTTKEGNFDTISFYKRFKIELTDFLRLFFSLNCHTILSCHVEMSASEEVAANVPFLQSSRTPSAARKEWNPLLTGKSKFILASIPDHCFYLFTESSDGLPTKFFAKLEADAANLGNVAKPRINPFKTPTRLLPPKNQFYQWFSAALEQYQKTQTTV